jgi:hypothetical protein
MTLDLAPLRRAHELLAAAEPVDDILRNLQMLFGLDYVDAMAAVAAVILLDERGLRVPDEPRPLRRALAL